MLLSFGEQPVCPKLMSDTESEGRVSRDTALQDVVRNLEQFRGGWERASDINFRGGTLYSQSSWLMCMPVHVTVTTTERLP